MRFCRLEGAPLGGDDARQIVQNGIVGMCLQGRVDKITGRAEVAAFDQTSDLLQRRRRREFVSLPGRRPD
jgi:hypothetical protein